MSLLLLFNDSVAFQANGADFRFIGHPEALFTFLPRTEGMSVNVGDRYLDDFEIRNSSTGDLADPTTLRCFVRSPSGTDTIYTLGVDDAVQRLSKGRYRLTLLMTEKGRWTHVPIVTGPVNGRESHSWEAFATIADTAIPPV